MSNALFNPTYPQDTTGSAVTNKITGEQQIVLSADATEFNFVVPKFAPFYAKGFNAKLKTVTGEIRDLLVGRDFAFTHRFIDASLATADDLFGSMTFLDTSLSGVVTIGYQTVGAPWTLDDAAWAKVVADRVHNPRVTSWDRVTNPPYSFPPREHPHPVEDMTGMADVRTAIQGVERALANRSDDDLGAHINNQDNPHKTTAQQTGAYDRAQADLKTAEATQGAIAAHLGATDPHSQYLTAERANSLITKAVGAVRQPKNVSPAEGAVSVSQTAALIASPYYTLYGLGQNAAQFQVSRRQDFSADIVLDSGALGAVTQYAVPGGTLSANVAFFWRCRFRDTEGVWSDWSQATAFSTGSTIAKQPVMTSPANGAIGVSTAPNLTSSAFAMSAGNDTHASSDWEIWTGPGGTGVRVLNVIASTGAKLAYSVAVGVLSPNITYYARVRHNAQSAGASAWSNDAVFTTTGVVAKPSITSPVNGDVDIPESPRLTSAAFSVTGATDTHASTDWQIWTGANGTGTKVWELLGTADKLQTTVPLTKLSVGTTYFARVRHNGQTLGPSLWSNDASFKTADTFIPTVPGTPFAGGYYAGRMMQIDPATNKPALYALIVAPKSSGDSIQYHGSILKNLSQTDGLRNTQEIRSQSPAAAWAMGLTIAGFSDWYIPADLELEIIYRYLKPTSEPNTIASSGGRSYASGANTMSVPETQDYTVGDPARTSATSFQSGNPEAFTGIYQTSTLNIDTEGGSQRIARRFDGNGGPDWTYHAGVRMGGSGASQTRVVRRVKIS